MPLKDLSQLYNKLKAKIDERYPHAINKTRRGIKKGLRVMNAKVKKYILCVAFFLFQSLQARLSSLAYNDPFPAFSTRNPFDLLNENTKAKLKKRSSENSESLSFAISPFMQKAKIGKNRHRQKVELGNVRGRWNMVGLLYGDVPCGQTRPDLLETAYSVRLCDQIDLCALNPEGYIVDNTKRFLHDPQYSDTSHQFGFFSVPLRYRKVGVRFEMIGLLTNDIGLNIKCGVADITQTNTGMIDLTNTATGGTTATSGNSPIFSNTTNKAIVNEFLMAPAAEVFQQIGLNTYDFHQSSIEDLQVALFWRHAFEVNKGSHAYPEFLFIPFVTLDGSLGTGKAVDPALAFALPFGNNSHHAAGFSAGFSLDFVETIEIGIEFGATHFFEQEFHNVFVPTHDFQSGIYPYKTDIRVKPGNNWHFTALMNAYHFSGNLSFQAQYIFVTHKQDTITLLGSNNGTHTTVTCDDSDYCTSTTSDATDVFKPERLEKETAFSSQLINGTINYNVSPYASLGFLWQVPVTRRTAYRANTVMISFEARF